MRKLPSKLLQLRNLIYLSFNRASFCLICSTGRLFAALLFLLPLLFINLAQCLAISWLSPICWLLESAPCNTETWRLNNWTGDWMNEWVLICFSFFFSCFLVSKKIYFFLSAFGFFRNKMKFNLFYFSLCGVFQVQVCNLSRCMSIVCDDDDDCFVASVWLNFFVFLFVQFFKRHFMVSVIPKKKTFSLDINFFSSSFWGKNLKVFNFKFKNLNGFWIWIFDELH